MSNVLLSPKSLRYHSSTYISIINASFMFDKSHQSSKQYTYISETFASNVQSMKYFVCHIYVIISFVGSASLFTSISTIFKLFSFLFYFFLKFPTSSVTLNFQWFQWPISWDNFSFNIQRYFFLRIFFLLPANLSLPFNVLFHFIWAWVKTALNNNKNNRK